MKMPLADKTALVVEGGGMRGIFTAGVLDAFLEAGVDPFDLYFGVSAGAATLSSYLAGQYRRHFQIFTCTATRPEFMSLKKLFNGGSFMDLDWLWQTVECDYPLDAAAADRHLENKACYIVCTRVHTGLPAYHTPQGRDWPLYLKASSALPVLYRHFPVIGAEPMADGGIADPLPAQAAYKLGARRIVVVRTRPLAYRKNAGAGARVTPLLLRGYPGLGFAVRNQAAVYNRSVRFLQEPPPDAGIIQIAPPGPLKSGRTTRKPSLLREDYQTGLEQGRKALYRLKDFIFT